MATATRIGYDRGGLEARTCTKHPVEFWTLQLPLVIRFFIGLFHCGWNIQERLEWMQKDTTEIHIRPVKREITSIDANEE